MNQNDQLLFDLGGAPSLTRDDLVVSPSNVGALALIDNWPEWHGPYAILVGPGGCGKTHLGEIWRQKTNAFGALQSELDKALPYAESGTPILLDGLSKNGFDETTLFHLMNAVRTAKGFLLITASSNPDFWPIKTPDLLSRLKGATSIAIHEPDDALISAVIVKLFSDRQINIDRGVVEYMVLRAERSLAYVNRLVHEIDRAALANKAKISKQFVGQVMKSLDNSQPSFSF